MANNIESGITEATMSPARRLPSNKTRIKITINAPSSRFLETVLMARPTRSERFRNGSIVTPLGNDLCMDRILASTFKPFRINGYFELFYKTTITVDISHSGSSRHFTANNPILNGSQLHRGVFTFQAFINGKPVLVNFTQAR